MKFECSEEKRGSKHYFYKKRAVPGYDPLEFHGMILVILSPYKVIRK